MQFRYDIQALRGLAVFLVLFYHAGIGNFGAGYLGVDIFFVISGFLMTGIIARDMRAGTFTFRRFYIRRIRRLLPAAYVTIFVTIIGSFFFLTQIEYNAFMDQVVGAVTFTANIFLWKQENYFDNGAILKPLLHTWSLSIEEQFYLVIPFALFLTPRKYWLAFIALATLVSLNLCLYMVEYKPTGTFYLLPTRAWEMGIGAVGALLTLKESHRTLLSHLCWPAFFILIATALFWNTGHHPGEGAIIACLCTIIILLGNEVSMNRNPVIKGAAKIGDISYSLYLIHWPLFAFANNIYLSSEIPLSVRAGLVIASVLLAIASTRWVETPWRHASGDRLKKLLWVLAATSVFLLTLPYALLPLKKGEVDYSRIQESNSGLEGPCSRMGSKAFEKKCVTKENPEILVWGDSNAMHRMDGLVAVAKNGVTQSTLTSCSPIIGLAHTTYPDHPPTWSKTCIDFNNRVLKYLATQDSIKIVVLSSPFKHVTNPHFKGYIQNGKRIRQTSLSVDLAVEKFADTVKAIRALGKKVVLVSPPPHREYNVGICLERRATGMLTLGPYRECVVTVEAARAEHPYIYEFLDRVEKEADVGLVDFTDYLCRGGDCRTLSGDVPLYRDGGHFSREGSRKVFKEEPLLKDIYKKAR